MMADGPHNTSERIAVTESDLGWVKKIGGYVIVVGAAGFGAVFWQLYKLNATVAAMDAKLDAMAATLAVIAGN